MVPDAERVLKPNVDVGAEQIREDGDGEIRGRRLGRRAGAARRAEMVVAMVAMLLVANTPQIRAVRLHVQERQEAVEILVEHLRLELACIGVGLSITGLQR